jgi:predicted RNA binding protein YcfA (HicA-like mRNA interferase family)
MSEPRIKFSTLRQILLDSGFKEVAVSDSHVGFQHDKSDTLIVLPEYRATAHVAPHHLAQVRIMLDAKGLLDAEKFDRRLADVPARHPASS